VTPLRPVRNQLGYDTRSRRSALVMTAIDALRPWHRAQPFAWGESIVVSSVAGLGDLFIHVPLIAGIVAESRRRSLDVRVALRPALAEIGQLCGWEVLPFDNALAEFFKTPLKTNPLDVAARVREARRIAPQLWIDLSGNAVNALLIKLSGAHRLAARTTRGGRVWVDHTLPHELQENEYLNRERVAGHLGVTLDFTIFDRMRRASPAPEATVLSLTTACRWRNWPLAHFLAVVRAFPGRPFALAGVTREVAAEDRAALAELRREPNVTDFIDRLSLLDLVGLIQHARAVVTNDTAAAHIANAFRRPGVVLFGPENSDVFAAPDGLRVLHDLSCPYHPCIQWTCQNPGHWCMTLIPPSAVIEHLAALP